MRRRAASPPRPANPPVTANDSYTATTATELVVQPPGVLANDILNGGAIASYGADGGEQTVSGRETRTAEGGTVALRADGGLAYASQPGFAGTDVFRYVVRNAGGWSTATVVINVVAQPPVAANDSFTTPHQTVLERAAPGVLANDTLHGAILTSYGASTGTEESTMGTSVATSRDGRVVVNRDGSFRYTPPSNFSGSDSFRYVIRNSIAFSTGTVTITVQAPPAPDFVVTASSSAFMFSGVTGPNPVLTLERGRTYRFQISTGAAHPFVIAAPEGTVTNNRATSGILTFKVPDENEDYFYFCLNHNFGNAIRTVP